MTIPALPPLDRTSPTFRTDLDTFFLTQLPATVTALNSELTRIDGILPEGYVATSTTSLTVSGSGVITPTVQTNKGFAPGQFVVISVTADPAVQMGGTVTAYDYTTGVLSVSVSQSAGSGTYAAWTVAISTASASPYAVGDIVLTNRALSAPAWLPADGATYSQSSYAALYAEVGLIKDGLSKNFLPAAVTTQATPSGSEYAPEGFKEWPLASFGSYALLYTKATGASNSKFARTTDGGATWTDITLPTTASDANYYRVVSHNGGTTLVAAHNSTNAWVAQSSDSGLTWNTRSMSGYAGGGQLFVLNGVYIIMNSAGTTMWKSADGITWFGHTTPVALTCQAVLTYQGSQVAIATTGAAPWTTVYTSSADGLTWTARTTPSISSYFYKTGLASVNDVFVWASGYQGAGGAYMRSADGGATWAAQNLPYTSATPPYVTSPMQVFEGRFVTALAYYVGYVLTSSADGLAWEITQTPISVNTATNHAPGHKVVGGSLYLLDAVTGAVTLYRLDSWKSAFAESYLGHINGNYVMWYIQQLCETANIQLTLSYYTTSTANTGAYRRPLYTYNTGTQFAVPTVPAPTPGVTAYIKA